MDDISCAVKQANNSDFARTGGTSCTPLHQGFLNFCSCSPFIIERIEIGGRLGFEYFKKSTGAVKG